MNDTARRLLAEVTRLEWAGALAQQRLRAIRWEATPAPVATVAGGNTTADPVTATEEGR